MDNWLGLKSYLNKELEMVELQKHVKTLLFIFNHITAHFCWTSQEIYFSFYEVGNQNTPSICSCIVAQKSKGLPTACLNCKNNLV